MDHPEDGSETEDRGAARGPAAAGGPGREWDPNAGAVVDARGRPCPLPVIDLAKAIADVEVGQMITLLSDDPGSATDVPAWCRMRRHDLEHTIDVEGHTEYLVRRVS